MSADQFLSLFTQAVILIVLVATVRDAIRRRRRAEIEIALFFAVIVAMLVVGDIETIFGVGGEGLTTASLVLLVALPYLLLRLVDDFSDRPAWLMHVAAVIFILLLAAMIMVPSVAAVPFVALPIGWIVIVGGYSSLAFLHEARRATGVTSRRMLAVASGSALIAGVFLFAGIGAFVPAISWVTAVVVRLLAVATAIAYYLGFAPPAILRRAWQEPELRAFLERAAALPRLPDMPTTVRQIERGAAQATGATGASLGLWDPERDRLIYVNDNDEPVELAADQAIGGKAFSQQRAVFSANAIGEDPANAQMYRDYGVEAIMAAPVTLGEKRIGVLGTYTNSAPVFADDDLRLVQLLADQAGVILENRRLIEEAARVQAREEAALLKDDFLSAAAHDLRTPLTTLLLHAEMLRRQIDKDPQQPADARRIDAIVREGNRLKVLVTDFLDAARAERGVLLGRLEPTDLVSLAQEAAEVHATLRHAIRVEADAPVITEVDPDRMRQLFDNLVENAIKYSPDGGDVVMALANGDGVVQLSVSDSGIGIPADDLPHLFQRFHRGSNVDDRRFHGLGLGLYICRSIAEEHGGQIWATSEMGVGTTFHVTLPLARAESERPAMAETPADDASRTSAPGLAQGTTGLADA
ncbi:MAG TPA: ATP-binding protein [Candidatus Limnocylindria bacterium]|jgi:signal transduction histidine kinase|nr:ATP-binding protein [Candidatus Limnocylindria bacterium]